MANKLLCTLWAFACVALAGNALAAPEPGTISVSSLTANGCTFTVNVTWSGFTGAKDTLEASLLKVFLPTGDGLVLESVIVQPVKGKGGSASLTPPASRERDAELLSRRNPVVRSEGLDDRRVSVL